MIVAFFALTVLAQVGIGIDRPPAKPPVTASSVPATAAPKIVRPSASSDPKPLSANLCAHAADVAIDSATQEKTDSTGGVDNFLIHVSILNRGSASQGPRVKQLISVYRNEERIARMQIPALEAGEAYAFTTKFKRSAEAGIDSTTLLFRLGGENYAPRSVQDCNDRNNSFRLTF